MFNGVSHDDIFQRSIPINDVSHYGLFPLVMFPISDVSH